MSSVSLETATLLAKVAFLIGAATDGFALVAMLSARLGSALFGGEASRNGPTSRYAMGIGASLMAGWTLLLLWGAADPIARRDVLVLTVFPVITGIVVATVIAARRGVVRVSRVMPVWIHLGLVSLFYSVVYVLSSPFAR